MSVSVTVAELISDVETRCALPVCTASTNVTAAAILRMVKQSAERLTAKFTRKFGDNYFATEGTITTTGNQSFSTLPANFQTLLKAYWVTGGKGVPLEMAEVDDWTPANLEPQAWPSNTGLDGLLSTPVKYRLQGNRIVFYPCPNAGYIVSLTYTSCLSVISTASQLDVQVGWDEWIVLDVCIRVRQRQQKAAADFVSERALIEGDILGGTSPRDRNASYQVRDERTARDHRGYYRRGY